MSHPYAAHRQTAKEHSRVKHITKGYASGGAVIRTEDDSKVRKMSASQEREANPEGGVAPHRADRPKRRKRADGGQVRQETVNRAAKSDADYKGGSRYGGADLPSTKEGTNERAFYDGRAKGGRVKSRGSAKTIVNVITGGHPPGVVPPMPGPPAGIAPAAMAPPPMAAKPPMMPPPGAGGPPPGGPPMPKRAKGGAVKSIGMKVGTPVSHTTGKSDLPDMNRKRVVTFNTGGGVKTFMAGGRVESPDVVAAATRLPGGGGGGEARLAKAHRAERR